MQFQHQRQQRQEHESRLQNPELKHKLSFKVPAKHLRLEVAGSSGVRHHQLDALRASPITPTVVRNSTFHELLQFSFQYPSKHLSTMPPNFQRSGSAPPATLMSSMISPRTKTFSDKVTHRGPPHQNQQHRPPEKEDISSLETKELKTFQPQPHPLPSMLPDIVVSVPPQEQPQSFFRHQAPVPGYYYASPQLVWHPYYPYPTYRIDDEGYYCNPTPVPALGETSTFQHLLPCPSVPNYRGQTAPPPSQTHSSLATPPLKRRRSSSVGGHHHHRILETPNQEGADIDEGGKRKKRKLEVRVPPTPPSTVRRSKRARKTMKRDSAEGYDIGF
ncbi:hypothetical protein BT69DRAFT_1356866 [Atractiella rhizophila]|nr:hypothetical protein BT69DRAFT_1356866 [Atractiella rhizophila]